MITVTRVVLISTQRWKRGIDNCAASKVKTRSYGRFILHGNEDLSPPRQTSNIQDVMNEDLSPPRRPSSKKSEDGDLSPPRRSTHPQTIRTFFHLWINFIRFGIKRKRGI